MDTTTAIFTNYQWWSSFLPNSELDSDKVTTWQTTGETTDDVTDSEKEIVESSLSGNYSYTRYFKIVARGPAGDSKPAYGKHVYAVPNAAKNVKASAVKLQNGNGYRISVLWSADETKARPIDSISIEYAIAKPVTTRTLPSSSSGVVKTTWSVPNISQWTTATTMKDTTTSNGDVAGASFTIDTNLDGENADKCIFVRVVTKHDNQTNPSDTVFVDGGYGVLSTPVISSIEVGNNRVAAIEINNTSELTASFVGIYHRTDTNPDPRLIGIWPAGNSQTINVDLPDIGTALSESFGIQAFLADYSPKNPSGVTSYAISNIKMNSEGIVWDDRPVPKPPSNVTLTSPKNGVVRVTWDWSWLAANGVEISWANHDDAWESTDEPSTYVLENKRVSAWNIAGLDVGTWYFKVRLFKIDGEATTYGTYSDIYTIKLASSPATPVLTLSPSIIEPNGSITCYWAFTATDGDEQVQADICEAFIDNNGTVTYGNIIAKANNEQYKTIDTSQLSWASGSKHYLSVRIVTTSGEESDNWSVPKPVQILEPISCEITSTSLASENEWLYLEELPLTIAATGAGESGMMTYILERASDYHLDRPDNSEINGFKGETVALIQKSPANIYSATSDTTVDSAKAYYTLSGGEYTEVTPASGANPSSLGYYEISSFNYDVSIGLDDLIGPLDDGARYNLLAIARDSYGQTATTEVTFDVRWDHQAVVPTANVVPDNEETVVYITPILPSEGYEIGDTCDVYRLSPDKPELILSGAEFGITYVDPYPSLGRAGGHRIVYKTINGDFITEDNEFAWTDYGEAEGDIIDLFATIIDFGDDQIILPYDLSLSTSWNKDFTKTKYLGGSIQGDWNPGIERSGSVKGRVAVQQDSELVSSIRLLANYSGICHIRTPDGSSYAANVNVTEDREEKKINMLASFTFNIDRVDSQALDGMTYEDWNKESEE